MKSTLTINNLIAESKIFCEVMTANDHSDLIGVTDGKAVGTYVEHKFKNYLSARKVTSTAQPQSSCPFESARQKIFGLGYNLLIFVYNKHDFADKCTLQFLHCVFIEKQHTGDFNEILFNPPPQGCLTISNALQWRLQYSRAISLNNSVAGVTNYDW